MSTPRLRDNAARSAARRSRQAKVRAIVHQLFDEGAGRAAKEAAASSYPEALGRLTARCQILALDLANALDDRELVDALAAKVEESMNAMNKVPT